MSRLLDKPSSGLAWLAGLREPSLTLEWTLPEWERILRVARRLRLLGRLAEGVDRAQLMSKVPAPVMRSLDAELRYSRWRTGLLTWSLERVRTQLGGVEYPCVLLKGAAYVGQNLDIAAGRLPSDIDVLVPREHLADAQARLARAGWAEVELDAHDRNYYLQWSHEVPPMQHPLLAMELDLHHNILPPTTRGSVDMRVLLSRLQPARWPGWQVFDPQDQVLHSAGHLFHDSEARDRLRDLVDMDGMLRHFGKRPEFWEALPERAVQLGLAEPLALACHFLRAWFDAPIPELALERIRRAGPGTLRLAWLLPLLEQVLTPSHPDYRAPIRQGVAAGAFLVRHHLGRMPMRVLLPHLWHKWHGAGTVKS